MEIAAVTPRERRKRVHSTKCPCRSHEQGKPELKAKESRKRKGNEIKPENAPLLKTKRLTKSVKSKTAPTLKSTDSELSSFDFKDENSNTEGRVLRSGRSTPVYIETSNEKERPPSQTKTKLRKPIKQKVAVDRSDIKQSLSGIKTEQDADILGKNNVTIPSTKGQVKAKSLKALNKVANLKSKSSGRSLKAQKNTCAKQKVVKVAKTRCTPKSVPQKIPANFSKVTKNKRSQMAKMKGSNFTMIASPKKTSAIEKLKVRAFDQLKEKLEIAFDRSSISVPECVQLLQQITSPNLSEIFDSQPASVDEGSSESLVAGLAGKSLPEIMTQGIQRSESTTNKKEKLVGDKPITKEKAVADNLSKAAQALVSFKIQTSNTVSTNSRSRLEAPSLDQCRNSTAQITQVDSNFGFSKVNSMMGTSTGFSVVDQLPVKNGMGNQFGSAMSTPRQTGTVNNFPSTTAFGQKIQESSTVEQSTLNRELQTSNLGKLVVTGDPIVKMTNITESSAGLTSTNYGVSAKNLLLETTPLIPATQQVHQTTNSLILTNNQLLQTTSPTIPTTNPTIPTTNPTIPTTNQLLQASSFLASTNALIPTTSEVLTSLPNVSAVAATKTDTALIAISPGLSVVQGPNILNQPQIAFQFVQGKSQGTNSTIPAVVTSTQPTPRLICANPATLPRNTTPSNPQQPATLLTTSINQRLFLPKVTPPLNQKTLGSNLPTIAPAIKQPHDLFLSTTANQVVGTVPATSTNELVSSTKLRPILPREPVVSSTFTIFDRPQQTLQKTNVGKAGDVSINVKQAVKRLVNGRTRNSDNHPATQKTTSLPDIASTFNKSIFTANSSTKVVPTLAPAQNTLEFSEMANKEQAIKALLSIGNEHQVLRQGAKGTSRVAASKVTQTKNTEDLLVVFDTDKGIFKVDDVTIDPEVNTIGKESYTCGKCGKIFTSLSYLARHIKRVCPDMTHRKWKCDHCDKAFRHPFGLQQHVFTHTGERPHKCSQCPKAFYSSNDLRRHSRIHSGERPYKCKHCGKTFATTISLKTHTFIHTGEKPHRCPHCPKTFATSSKLGRHIVTHSEQRPFACPHCPKTFNRSGDLRRHKQTLHDEKIPAGVQDVKEIDSKEILSVSQELISNITEQ